MVGLRLTKGGGRSGALCQLWFSEEQPGLDPPNIPHENFDFARVLRLANNLSTLRKASLVYFLLEPQPQLTADSYIEVVHY